MKKYDLIREKSLFRIVALKDFSNVKKGDLGGLIEKEGNLDQQGNCWVYGNARIIGDAFVCDNARVYGNAFVGDNAKLYGNAFVGDNARVSGNVKVSKEVIVLGNAFHYYITITDNYIQIDCKQYLKSEWLQFTDEEILKMDGKKALKFWRLFKPFAINMGFFN